MRATLQEIVQLANERATKAERERILKLLYDQNIIRDCAATGKPVAFTTDGKEVVYIKGLTE